LCLQKNAISTSTARIKSVYNEVKREIERTQVLPNVAYRITKERVRNAFDDHNAQHEAIVQLGAFQSKQRTFRRHVGMGKPPKINNAYEIPDGYKNYGTRPNFIQIAYPNLAHLSDFFVFYNEQRIEQKPTILASNITGLNIFHRITHIVCDGTFLYCPKPFVQAYLVHAAHFSLPNRAESTLIGIALLMQKDAETYRKMFDIFSERIYGEFGSLGCSKIVVIFLNDDEISIDEILDEIDQNEIENNENLNVEDLFEEFFDV